MAISVKNVTKRFGDFVALDDVSIDVPDGGLTALLGPSGSGKSTLLRVIAGLEQPDAGQVLISGEDNTETRVQDRNVGFVFQHYAAFKHMTVFDNIAFGLRIRGRGHRHHPRAGREADRSRPPAGLREALPQPALGWTAAAHGAGPGAGGGAAGAAARRALRRSRRQGASGAAYLAAPPPRRRARDDDLRHPRPGGGDGRRRADHRHERRPGRAVGWTARPLRGSGVGVRDELHRPGAPPGQRLGAPARRRDPSRAERQDDRGDGGPDRSPRLRGEGRVDADGRGAVLGSADPRRGGPAGAERGPDRLRAAALDAGVQPDGAGSRGAASRRWPRGRLRWAERVGEPPPGRVAEDDG